MGTKKGNSGFFSSGILYQVEIYHALNYKKSPFQTDFYNNIKVNGWVEPL